jgi:hypothetical protein
MCVLGKVDPPKLPSMPPVPSANMEEVREREARERAAIATAGQGTTGTIKTDLAPASVQGQQQRKVLLGAV